MLSNAVFRSASLVNISLVVISIVISAVVGEVFLRLYGHRGAPESIISNIRLVEDKTLNWRYIPNSIVETGSVSYQYNDMGFRDVHHNRERTDHVHRVIVVGDSVSEGAEVAWESIFASQLQDRLGVDYEIINLAMSGLNTPQEIHLLEKEGLVYKPDTVILNFVLNDVDFYTEYFAAKRFEQEKDSTIGLLGMSISPKAKRLLKSSALIYFVKERVENLVGRLMGKQETNYFVQLWDKPENRKKILEGFARLGELSRAHCFRAVVVIWPLLTDYGHYEFTSIHEWTASVARRNEIGVIDLYRQFSKMSFRDLQVTAEDNVHPNATGYRIAAQTVSNMLNAQQKSLDCMN